MLQASNSEIRAGTCYVAGLLQLKEMKDALESILSKDENAEVRYWAAESLGEIGDLMTIPYLERSSQDLGESSRGEYVAAAVIISIKKIEARFREAQA